MNTGGLDVFHYAHHVEILSVEDGIDLGFLASIEEVIDQDLIAGDVFEQTDHGFFYFFIVDHNAHALSAEHITRTNQHWVSHFIRYFDGVIDRPGRTVFRVRNIEGFQHVAESAAVFGDVQTIERGADDLDAFFGQALGEFECGLSAELYDHAFRFLVFDNLPQMLPIHGFEIKFIGHVEIGRDRFGIAIHHDGFVAALLDGE